MKSLPRSVSFRNSSGIRDASFESGEAAQSGPIEVRPAAHFGRDETIVQEAREKHGDLDALGLSEQQTKIFQRQGNGHSRREVAVINNLLTIGFVDAAIEQRAGKDFLRAGGRHADLRQEGEGLAHTLESGRSQHVGGKFRGTGEPGLVANKKAALPKLVYLPPAAVDYGGVT